MYAAKEKRKSKISMPRKLAPKPKLTGAEQSKRFIEADETDEGAERAFKKVAVRSALNPRNRDFYFTSG
jgi:hypothetical protein